jgi:glycine/D-amino acid oxidase-like deaminating enzyme
VLVIDAGGPASGASGAAGGLINPFPGRKAAPAWRHGEALDALVSMEESAGLLRRDGILRPALDARQATIFRERAAEHPDELDWLESAAVDERWPSVAAPDGALWVRHGGALDIPAFVKAVLGRVPVLGGTSVLDAGEDERCAWVETSDGRRLEAGTVLLAPGQGFRNLPALADLPLGRVKGQTIRLAWPDGAGLPLLAGYGYVVPEGETLIVGSTYERSFTHVEPTAEATRDILENVSRMVPGIEAATVIGAQAGVRVTVPARLSPRRLPMIGPLPGRRRLWAFVGLGSKGLLTAPLLSRSLPAWIDNPGAIPGEVRVRIDGAAWTYG